MSETTGYGTSTAATTAYCYDPDGDRTAVIYGDGNTGGTANCETAYPWTVNATNYPTQADYQIAYSYDSVGELVYATTPKTATDPDGATTTNTYDAAGNELTTTDPALAPSSLATTTGPTTKSPASSSPPWKTATRSRADFRLRRRTSFSRLRPPRRLLPRSAATMSAPACIASSHTPGTNWSAPSKRSGGYAPRSRSTPTRWERCSRPWTARR